MDVASRVMREKAENVLPELKDCQNGMFRLVRGLQISAKVVGVRCMRGSYGKLCFSVMEINKARKDYIERVMKKMIFIIMWKQMQ